jgi:TolB protein
MIWSPDGRHISFLSGQSDGTLAVRVVAADGSAEPDLLGTTTSSSYFAWKPDSSALLLHMGGASFEEGRVAAYEPGNAKPLQELADPGLFKTPAWSADGSQFFYVAQPAVTGVPTPEMVESVLTSVSPDGATQALASEKMAALLFARAPASDDIAYTTFGPAGFGPLKMVGAGVSPHVISRDDEQIPAFFWSPDGSQIAYLTVSKSAGGGTRLTWHVVGREGGAIRDLSSFVPSQAFVAMISYFDAYAFSLNMWSAKGDKLVYGADDGVYVLDVPSGKVERRADGAMATWVGPR